MTHSIAIAADGYSRFRDDAARTHIILLGSKLSSLYRVAMYDVSLLNTRKRYQSAPLST